MATILGEHDVDFLEALDMICSDEYTAIGKQFDLNFWNWFSFVFSNEHDVQISTVDCLKFYATRKLRTTGIVTTKVFEELMATILGEHDVAFLEALVMICNNGNTQIGKQFDLNFWNSFSFELSNENNVQISTVDCLEAGRHHKMVYDTYKEFPHIPLQHPDLEPEEYRELLVVIFRDNPTKPNFPPPGDWGKDVDANLKQKLVKVLGAMMEAGAIDIEDVRVLSQILTDDMDSVAAHVFLAVNLVDRQTQMAHQLILAHFN
ncbi:hypothetical protein LXL04_007520 [Taraxacum kok-saghyz]